ncbi:MAG: hypothetical protein U1E05_01865 [Patescibacteria group bacterium]|nr:hypothetical protein [Patescibacteria group bacterium]
MLKCYARRKAMASMLFMVVATVFLGWATARTEAAEVEVWLVSTRSAPRASAADAADERIGFRRLSDNRWTPSDRGEFHAAGHPGAPTLFLVHGNRTAAGDAIQMGTALRRQLERTASDQPFRLVIWSWPSEQVCGGARADVQLKAQYSDVQAYYLAECLREMPPEQPVTLAGYSFGARVITGALELLAGGRVGRYQLNGPAQDRKAPWRAVLIAAALDAHWLSRGHRNGQAMGQVDRMLITANPADRVMRLYPRMYGRRGPDALGYCAAGYSLSPADRAKVRCLDLSCSVGREHGWWSYWRSASLRATLAEYTFGTP